MTVYSTIVVPYCFVGWNLFFPGLFCAEKGRKTGKDTSHRVNYPGKSYELGYCGDKSAKLKTVLGFAQFKYLA